VASAGRQTPNGTWRPLTARPSRGEPCAQPSASCPYRCSEFRSLSPHFDWLLCERNWTSFHRVVFMLQPRSRAGGIRNAAASIDQNASLCILPITLQRALTGCMHDAGENMLSFNAISVLYSLLPGRRRSWPAHFRLDRLADRRMYVYRQF
jgi:hypothetical protein